MATPVQCLASKEASMQSTMMKDPLSLNHLLEPSDLALAFAEIARVMDDVRDRFGPDAVARGRARPE